MRLPEESTVAPISTCGTVAGDAEQVVAETAEDTDVNDIAAAGIGYAGAQDVELIVAFGAIDDKLFDVLVRDVQAGAEDAGIGDEEAVGELGADDP